MCRKMPIILAALALGGTLAVRAESGKSGVRDRAGLFSPEAVAKADRALREVERETGWQAVVETVPSLEGRPIRERVIEEAKAAQVHGLFILISKGDHETRVEPSRSAEKAFPKPEVSKVVELLDGSFRRREFDAGLLAAVDEIREAATRTPARAAALPSAGVATARTESAPVVSDEKPAPGRPAEGKAAPGPLRLAAYAAGLLALFWIIGRIFRRSPQPQGTNAGPAVPPGAPYPQQQGTGPGVPTGPQPGAGVGPRPGYGPTTATGTVPPAGPAPGYGYGPAGYPAGPGYAAPPPPQGGGGGFVSGALGGLGGAVLGNVLYDKFGRPHPDPGQGIPHGGADVIPPASHDPVTGGPAWTPTEPASPEPPAESYDPDAGTGGDWGSPSQEPAAADAGQDWGGADGGGDWGGPDTGQGAGGDWSGGDASGQGGDWGGGEETSEPDPGGGDGGDWGGGDGGGDTNQGDW